VNREWLLQLASDIEERHGKEVRDRILGDIDGVGSDPKSISAWFENFTTGMDELDDKGFLQRMMADRCPCGGDYEKDGKAMKDIYEKSDTLVEFVDTLRKWLLDKYGDTDKMALRGNVLYMTKPLGESTGTGRCGRGCHCWLAMHTDKTVSDIFCHCCTIGHTGRPFQVAFGNDIKMEFIESIICGGRECTMTVHLPEKHKPVNNAL
jgi:hypothetical protein